MKKSQVAGILFGVAMGVLFSVSLGTVGFVLGASFASLGMVITVITGSLTVRAEVSRD